MATTTVYCNKDARVAQNGSTNLGSGASDGLPFGLYSGYRYRALLGFPVNMAGWTAINSATLYIRNSNQIHVAFGSSPTLCTRRINVNWSEGSSSGLSGSNAVIYPGPNATTVNQVAGSGVGVAENTWKAISITAMMRDVLAGNPFYGLQLTAWDGSGESNSSVDVGEIYSREAGSAAYIVFDYNTNTPPNAPTVTSADVVGGICGTTTPTLDFLLSDPQGDTLTEYQWQIDNDSDFSSPIQNPIVAGSFANNSHQTVVPTALTRGTTYYVRCQAKDASVYGAWSSTFSFKVASLPTVTVSEPSGAGRLGRTSYDAGSGWASPRLRVDWDTVCPDGGLQQSYRVEIANDSAGSPGTSLYDSTTLTDASTRTVIVPATLTEGAYYHVRVTATCSHGLSQTVAYRRVRVRWGVVTHQFNMGGPTGSLALTILDVTDETTGGSGRVVVEYATGATTAAPASNGWSGTIGGAGLLQYLNYRTWLLVWGASPAVSPTLNEIKVTYSAAVIVPDKWVLSDATNQSGDVAAYVYGTKSFRMKGKGSTHYASQAIPVAPNTFYMVSGRIQTNGVNTGAYIGLATAAAGPDIVGATTPPQNAAVGFESPLSRVQFAVPWFSGNNTQMYVRMVMAGAVGTTAWFDALKVEASTVVTPWSPGYIANAVVLDAGGLQIDAANGGIARFRGSAGGARDTVDLGVNGLVFGGDLNLWSPASERLDTDGSFVSRGVMASGAGGGTGGYWARVATGVLTNQFHGHHFFCAFGQSWGTSVTAGNSIASITVQQQAGFGSQPNVIIHVLPGGAQVASDIAVVVTSVAGPTTYEVWVRSTTSYGQPFFALLHAIESVGGAVVPVEGYALQAAIGAGTAYYGRAWNSGLATGGGAAFPLNPVTNDRYWRTDLGLEFYWDGTRWLTTELFHLTAVNGQPTTLSATGAILQWGVPALLGCSDIWMVSMEEKFIIAGGTALSGAVSWTLNCYGRTVGDANSAAIMPTRAINSGAVSQWRQMTTAINALLGPFAVFSIAIYWTKLSTPGNLTLMSELNYRLVAT